MTRKKLIMQGLVLALGLLQILIFPIDASLAHGGGDGGLFFGITLSLEEIYLLTLGLGILSAMSLTLFLRINDKKLLILMISLAALFLTLDYFYLKFFVYS